MHADHVYEEPSLSEPAYEELRIKCDKQPTTFNKDHTGDLETDMNVAYQTTGKLNMTMTDCPAYQ